MDGIKNFFTGIKKKISWFFIILGIILFLGVIFCDIIGTDFVVPVQNFNKITYSVFGKVGDFGKWVGSFGQVQIVKPTPTPTPEKPTVKTTVKGAAK